MISNTQITQFLLNAVSSSDEVKGYCDKHFNRALLQFVGVNVNDAPRDDDLPVLIYEPLIKNIGNTQSEFEYEFLLKLVIKGSDKPKKKDDVLIYEGIYQIEQLGNLICECISGAINYGSNLELFDIAFYHDEIALFPIYSGSIMLKFSIPHVIGCKQLTLKGV